MGKLIFSDLVYTHGTGAPFYAYGGEIANVLYGDGHARSLGGVYT